MRKKIVSVAALAAVLTANSLAALNSYLVLKGPQGLFKASVAGRETDKFAIASFSAPKPAATPAGIVAPQRHGIIAILIGLLSQPMRQAMTAHTVLPELTIFVFDKKGTGKSQEFLKITLEQVLVSSVEAAVGDPHIAGDPHVRVEKYDVSFSKMTQTKVSQGAFLDDWMKLPVGQGE